MTNARAVREKNTNIAMENKVTIRKTAGGIVVNIRGDILVVSPNRGSKKDNLWCFPKGKIEDGENEQAAARREIGEESGVTQLELVRELGGYQRPDLDKENVVQEISMFLFRTGQAELNPVDPEEIAEARWVTKDEVAGLG